jgi:hypothetical protein
VADPRPYLHLIVPGLFGPLPRRLFEMGFAWPRAPMLERLLARSERVVAPASGVAELLFRLFALAREAASELPSASLSRLGEGFAGDDACWIHADPVHLKPDLDRVLLFDARHLELTQEQAEALAQEVETFYREDGWRLQVAAPERWYLRLPQAPELLTQPLEKAVGRNMEPFLPQGRDAGAWRTRLNEVQMLMHHSAVNQRRERCGRAAINGLWFWGVGRLPAVPGPPPFTAVYTEALLARGMALHAGTTPGAPPAGLDPLLRSHSEGNVLVLLEDLSAPLLDADALAWKQAVESLERSWFAPLGVAFGKRLCGLSLYPGQGDCYTCCGGWLGRFWRRTRSLESYLESGGSEAVAPR